jgi:hypothetical protein
MSEHQYYEFQAIDRPLDRTAQEALRSISSRARITATSFTKHYEWGDLKGDPSTRRRNARGYPTEAGWRPGGWVRQSPRGGLSPNAYWLYRLIRICVQAHL